MSRVHHFGKSKCGVRSGAKVSEQMIEVNVT